MTMKRIATFIALGSILTGIIVCFWPPAPCQDEGFIPCLNGLAQIMHGCLIIVGGIALLILIPIANLHNRVLTMIGAFVSFVIAFLFLGVILVLLGSTKDLSQFRFFLIMIGSIQAIAFLCTGLSATGIKNLIASRRASGKTL